jgi:hypothetical protein
MTALYKWLAGAVLVLLCAGSAWLYWGHLQSTISGLRADVVKAQSETTEARAQRDSAQATTRVVTQTVEKIVEVKVKGDTIIQKVPVYVTTKADNKCTVTNGAVSVLNAAASNVLLPGNPSGIQDGASGVAFSTVVSTASQWASLYWQLATRYEGLLAWTEAQGAICRGGGVAKQK